MVHDVELPNLIWNELFSQFQRINWNVLVINTWWGSRSIHLPLDPALVYTRRSRLGRKSNTNCDTHTCFGRSIVKIPPCAKIRAGAKVRRVSDVKIVEIEFFITKGVIYESIRRDIRSLILADVSLTSEQVSLNWQTGAEAIRRWALSTAVWFAFPAVIFQIK